MKGKTVLAGILIVIIVVGIGGGIYAFEQMSAPAVENSYP
jgi:uncharacterized protein YxeA